MLVSHPTPPNLPHVDMPRLLLALMAPPKVDHFARQVIQDLSDRYHTRTARIAPHITLQAPFRWSRDRIAELEQGIVKFTQEASPIPITLNGFGAFGQKVLYIHVQKSQELMTFQTALAHYLEETFNIIDPKAHHRPFTPHMTIASRKLTPRTFKQAWADLQHYSAQFQYVSDRLTMLVYEENQWQMKHTTVLPQKR